eukprot:6382699-Karenia_brevis.AAC.1
MDRGCLSLDVISFSAAISACGKSWHWRRVAPLPGEMCRGCLSLDVISFSAAISACEKSWHWQRVAPLP